MTEKKPKVSVCVVTYNQEKYIRQCLQSIVDQETDFDFEVIVGDDCSTDKTKEIISYFVTHYPKQIKYFSQNNNVGPFKNMIDTCEKAKGDFIAHCDGDDFWLPNKLQTQIIFLETNIDVSGVFTNALIKQNLINPTYDHVTDMPKALKTIFTKSQFVRSSLVERRFDIQQIKTYFRTESVIYDFEMYWLNHREDKIAILGTPYVNYNADSQGISKDSKILERYDSAIERLKIFGLHEDTYQAMRLDFNIIKYLLNPSRANKVDFFSYLKSQDKQISILVKLSIPIFLLNSFRYLTRHFRALVMRTLAKQPL